MDNKHKKILAAYDLLQGDSITIEKFESIRILIHGISPKIDKLLASLSTIRADIQKLKQGDIIDLTAENLPEETQEDKKRKKVLLLFIRNWNQLKSEVERVKGELEKSHGDSSETLESTSNILARAKGPLGIVTVAAVVIAAAGLLLTVQKPSSDQSKEKTSPVKSPSSSGIKVIDFNGKKIPLSGLTTGIGPECLSNNKPAEHYHAKDHSGVTALDGTAVQDPGGCGFGKVSGTRIEEI